ncbi:MAG: RNA methyltransferase [Chloroflexi bacterium]|nr:MAG: RNA methyltransferase [Chloroflexota bacterium]
MSKDEVPFTRYRPLIDDWDAFQAAVKRPLPTTIWANPQRITPEALPELLNRPVAPIPWYPGGFRLLDDFPVGRHWAYLAGLYHVQEEVSLLPVPFLDIQPGDRTLDLCAAPGNKSAQIGVMLQGTGTIVANDRSVGRMRAASHALNRLGLVNVTTTTTDAVNYPAGSGFFHKILADVPCSCEGTCRKDRSVTWRVSLKDSQKLAGSQLAILRKAVQRCRAGGRIVYATCTFAPEENELIVNAMLQDYGKFVRLLPASIPGLHTSPGLTTWQGQSLHPDLSQAIRVWPHQNDTGGFFVAVLEKTEDARSRAEKPPIAELPWENVKEEREPWLTILADRFGMDLAHFDDFVIFREGRRGVYIANRDQQPPQKPKPDAVGMLFMHTEGKYPKLTTAAAMQFGRFARDNVIDLQPEQVQAFMARQDFHVDAAQVVDVSGTGYVILRYRGYVVGLGVYRQHLGLVESLYPKGWARKQVCCH